MNADKTPLQQLLAKQAELMEEYAETVQQSQNVLAKLHDVSEEIEVEIEKEKQRGTGREDVVRPEQ